jgi:hypothetical protein
MDRPYLSASLRADVITDSGNQCGYCHSPDALMGVSLVFDHIIPLAAGGPTTRENLWRACRQCNEFKGPQTRAEDTDTGIVVPLFHPRTQRWNDHFRWNSDYTEIVGISPTGRATVQALQLNRQLLVKARRNWRRMGWLPTPLQNS